MAAVMQSRTRETFPVLANFTGTNGVLDGGPGVPDVIRFFNAENRVTNQSTASSGNNAGAGLSFPLQDNAPNGAILSFWQQTDWVPGDPGKYAQSWNGWFNGENFLDDQPFTENLSVSESRRGIRWGSLQLGSVNSGEDWFKGDIAEVIIFDGVLSNADIKQVNDYLLAKYVPVPEPATMSLLALGGLALLRRKS